MMLKTDFARDWVVQACKARWLAFGGSVLSEALLITDLGRPSRFLHMLRVFKRQSTMSMGSWILSGFSVSASASLFGDAVEHLWGTNLLVHLLRGMGRIGSIAFGMPFHNYTGVLLATTALPVWNERASALPGHFGMSGLQAGASLLELMGHEDSRSLNLLGLFSASMETWEKIDIASRRSQALLPLKAASNGALVRAGAWLSGPVPLILRAASLRSRRPAKLRRVAAWSGIVVRSSRVTDGSRQANSPLATGVFRLRLKLRRVPESRSVGFSPAQLPGSHLHLPGRSKAAVQCCC